MFGIDATTGGFPRGLKLAVVLVAATAWFAVPTAVRVLPTDYATPPLY